MTPETFKKGMALISETFPKLDFNTTLYWKMLRDLKDLDFEKAVLDVIQELEELYPTSNLIAILRQRADRAAIKRLERLSREIPKLTRESAPPPPEWTNLVKRAFPKAGKM